MFPDKGDLGKMFDSALAVEIIGVASRMFMDYIIRTNFTRYYTTNTSIQ